MSPAAIGYQQFRPRPERFEGVREIAGYRMKLYSIVYGGGPITLEEFEEGLRFAGRDLPQPPVSAERPGTGFAIAHKGKTGDYAVVCWWDAENELPTRVAVRKSGEWRMSEGSESFCVWDLEVMWKERNAYVATVLTAGGGGIDAYLTSVSGRS